MELLLATCIFLAAVLYTSVGHAGATAYLALMALFSVPAATMRPTALVLNVLVSTFASFRYIRAGMFRWRTAWPFLIGAAPFAFIGGAIQLPGDLYKPVLGVVLWLGAIRLLWPQKAAKRELHDPPPIAGIAAGAGIGLISGLTGTGGGIFLSPLLLLMGWSDARTTSGVAAVFILAASTSGLLGNFSAVGSLPDSLPLFAASALTGAFVGTTLGTKFHVSGILRALSIVLIVSGAKLMFV
ncbi:sulfite exporter TauE/SafE family protein [Brevundimonas sp. BR2-1]|uniref:sulfite exporter TauE/SafE family protein n=1 Tax=Brevundimonas sp. BR2-1 TaxID=3031123 RepID=UPI0030A60327